MTTRQVTFLLLDLALIIVLSRMFANLARRIGQPPVIGEVAAGILVGPSLFHGAVSSALFPVDIRPFLSALANVGVALFMFIVGLELDQARLRGRGGIVATVSLSSIVLPFCLGACLALYLVRQHVTDHQLGFVLFIGAAMSVTAFPVLARILTDRGMHRTTLGGIALTCAAIDDVLAWSLLAAVLAVSGNATPSQWLIVLLLPYIVLMLWFVRPVLHRLVPTGTRLGPGLLAATLIGVLVSGAFTEWIGLHFLFGAFLFGVTLPRRGAELLREDILDRIGGFNSALLLPVFFVVAGLNVNLSTMDTSWLTQLGLVILVATVGKFGGAFAAAKLHRLPTRDSAALATMMNTRGLTELIMLSVGLQFGILDGTLYSIMVVMAVFTTGMAGPLLHLLHPNHASMPLGSHHAHRN